MCFTRSPPPEAPITPQSVIEAARASPGSEGQLATRRLLTALQGSCHFGSPCLLSAWGSMPLHLPPGVVTALYPRIPPKLILDVDATRLRRKYPSAPPAGILGALKTNLGNSRKGNLAHGPRDCTSRHQATSTGLPLFSHYKQLLRLPHRIGSRRRSRPD